MAPIDLKVYRDLETTSRALARRLIAAAAEAGSVRGRFCIALAGGATPSTLYRQLRTRFRREVDWRRVHVFWSDERYVAPSDETSNVGAARRMLLDALLIPPEQIQAPDTSLDDPEETARRYEAVLKELGPLDFVLLGLGEDGHIASLFPGSSQLEETEHLVLAVEDSPKPPPRRITMTLPAFAAAREVHVLAAGVSKRRAVSRVIKGERDEPVNRARRMGTRMTLWVDRAADAAVVPGGVESIPGEEPK